MKDLPLVECFPTGWHRGVRMDAACESLPVRAFPTWVIGDQIVEGELEFDAIESMLENINTNTTPAAAAAE